jgi:hypothetical protein
MHNSIQRFLKAEYLIPGIVVIIFVIVGVQQFWAMNDLKKTG